MVNLENGKMLLTQIQNSLRKLMLISIVSSTLVSINEILDDLGDKWVVEDCQYCSPS